MSMKKLTTALDLCRRANLPAAIFGHMGTGKSSVILNIYINVLRQLGQLPEKYHGKMISVAKSQLMRELSYGRDKYWLWWASAATLLLDEIIGYFHVHDAWKDADELAWKMAAQQAGSIEETEEIYLKLREMIFRHRGITESDKDNPRGQYIRTSQIFPPQDHEGGGILFLDEMNLGDDRVTRALMALTLDRRILDYLLPLDIWMVTTMNPPTGSYHSRDLNPPFLDRFIQFKAKTELKESLGVFEKMGVHPTVIDFVSDKGDDVHNPQERTEGEDFDIEVWCNNRSLADYCSELLWTAEGNELQEVGLVLFQGILGETIGSDFFTYASTKRDLIVRPDDIFENYGYDKKKYKDDETRHADWPDGKTRARVRKINNRATVRMDLLEPVLRACMRKLTQIHDDVLKECGNSRNSFKHTDTQKRDVINIMAFLCDVPADRARSFLFEEMQEAGNFDTTIGLYVKNLLCRDMTLHVKGKAIAAGVDVKQEDVDVVEQRPASGAA